MQDLLSYIITGITGNSAEIQESRENGFVVFSVKIPKDQVGIVIGRGGKTINAIKNIIKIMAIKEGVRIDVQINEA
ncbi:MAG: hypothetical protein A3C27_00535 [Candidatus Levybacteria bacterium RIFCSPHIGHO2_02_FULL_39_36]|nr:MAG: hypothetical protein UT20_C0001G0032 [Candidatus Levybacteria bacterium GW2011_GWA1_39_11]KKR25323.1 MAG: hypothetical protein UT56_C0001G0054 [Candidatus Levybacteria bacterium GW2011_GWB1_39_7]KKR27596.1 MAG: hypothetical protein UT57_C0001G0020 [Microgenomates group bacterium GW2011_GWC1_39_7]KKR50430.1 MAG: hypothetical protein UT85_C0002G0038 [Candidatus Levybacteria bacterium GW2011_GWA2_40_16]OGH14482.1 MAG: hypothetical protein A2689_00445 [Candidatus Levybacteria bacterium RIFC